MRSSYVLFLIFVSRISLSASLVGAWQSDCQNMNSNSQGYYSARPVDTFKDDGTAVLRVHVFQDKNCKGKEWDAEIIPCTFVLKNDVPNLESTKELDLSCEMDGGTHLWYEIAQVRSNSLRFGNRTGLTPEDRPKQLGSITYRLLAD